MSVRASISASLHASKQLLLKTQRKSHAIRRDRWCDSHLEQGSSPRSVGPSKSFKTEFQILCRHKITILPRHNAP